jgi:hypothetical protein
MNPFEHLPADVCLELLRLREIEERAWKSGDVESVVTCRLLWCELYLASGGIHSPALKELPARLDAARLRGPTQRELWRRRLAARPLVAIVRRRRVTWHDRSGAPHYYYKLLLACGHEVTDYAIFPDQPLPRRRRCAACGEIRFHAAPTRGLIVLCGGRTAATETQIFQPDNSRVDPGARRAAIV